MVKIVKKETLKSKTDSDSTQQASKKDTYKARQQEIKQQRIANFDTINEQMIAKGYKKNIATISVLKADIFALVVSLPFLIIALVFFYMHQGELTNSVTFRLGGYLLFMLLLFISIFVHEFLHGFGWSLYCNYRWKSIEFGVMWKYLTPYCHCKEILPPMQYLSGGLLPFMILGVGLNQVAVWTGNYYILALSLFNILAAGGDLTIALMLIKYRHKNTRIMDHPTECGFVAFTKSNS